MPIIDGIVRATCECGRACRWPGCVRQCETHPMKVHGVLLAALPWEPAAEVIEAMAGAIASSEYDEEPDEIMSEAGSIYRLLAVTAYRGQPLMHELYPEKF